MKKWQAAKFFFCKNSHADLSGAVPDFMAELKNL